MCQEPSCNHGPKQALNESMTYKDFIRGITRNNVPGAILNNLPYRDWAPLIKYVRFFGRDQGFFRFYVPNRYNGWFVYIQFVEWDEVMRDTSYTAAEAARLLLWAGNIRVHCPCPSFKFWGSQYILTQKDAAIIPEERYPHIRNPQLKGVGCKHVRRCMLTLAFHLGDFAKGIKEDRQTLGLNTK